MKYKTNFITSVILRLDFNAITNFDNELLNKFNEDLRHIFSKFEVKELNQFTSKIKDGLVENDLKKEPLGIFSSDNNSFQVTFAPNFILINTTRYETFEAYVVFTRTILDVFNKVSSVDFLNRIGLRFINQLNIPKNDPLSWTSYVNSALSTPVSRFFEEEDKRSIARSIGQTIFNYDSYLMNFIYGILNPDFPARVSKNEFILDYDCYAVNVLNEKLFETHINKFHTSIEKLFEKSITDKVRKIMGVEHES